MVAINILYYLSLEIYFCVLLVSLVIIRTYSDFFLVVTATYNH